MQPAVIRIYAAYKYNVLDLYQRIQAPRSASIR